MYRGFGVLQADGLANRPYETIEDMDVRTGELLRRQDTTL